MQRSSSRSTRMGHVLPAAIASLAFSAAQMRAATIVTTNTTQTGGTLVVNPVDELVVHGVGNPLLKLTSGATTTGVESVVIGTNVGPGQVRVEGASTLTNTGNGTNTGIYDGENIAAGAVHLGLSAGSAGTATVTGIGSQWNNGSIIFAGQKGIGTLNVLLGGEVTSAGGQVGVGTAANGQVNVNGSGSKWDSSSSMFVGIQGIGTLNVEDGGQVTNTSATLGTTATAIGEVNIDGAGSKWNSSDTLLIANMGTGTMNVYDGGEVTSNKGFLAFIGGSTGTATVSGTGSKWTTTAEIGVGSQGTGIMNVEAGGQVSNTVGVIGESSGSNGTVTVTGAGSKWTNSVNLIVGSSGVGTLNVESGGRVDVAGSTFVFNSDSVINLKPGGTLKTAVLNLGGVAPRFDWTGGTLLITGTTGDVPSVPSAGTLGGTGTILNPVVVDGALAPGTSIGTLKIANTQLHLAPGATLNYEFDLISGDLVSGIGGNDALVIAPAGTLSITSTSPTNPLLLFTGFETISGISNLNSWSIYVNGYLNPATFDTSVPGAISVVIVPEPTSLAILSFAGLAVLRRRR